MIKYDNKGNIVACITTKEDLDYSNFDLETISYYDNFLIPSYERIIDNLNSIIKEVREYIEQDIKANYFKRYDDEVYKICDELLEILDKADKENNNEDN